MEGYKVFRLDRAVTSPRKVRKRGGGLLTYVNSIHSKYCESLSGFDQSDKNIEAQWILLHRPHCKDVVTCNVYRPPNRDLQKTLTYLEECMSLLYLK